MNTAKGNTKNYLRSAGPNCFFPIYIKDNKVWGFGDVCKESFHPEPNIVREDNVIEVYPIDSDGVERKWFFARQSVEGVKNELSVQYNRQRNIWEIVRTKTKLNYKTVWTDKKYSAKTYGTQLLNSIIGVENESITFPKSLHTVLNCIKAATNLENKAVVLDFFAGSGTTAHAVINLNREDGGNRKYILVEMANYFDNVLLPRIKKVVFTDDLKDGKPQNINGISHFIKYQCLEQYEDALDNLELVPDKTAQTLFGDEYLLKYFLDLETRDNSSLLNIEQIKRPFSYKLRVNLEEVGEPQEVIVDIPETFHYLLGLKVNKVKVRKDKGKKYLFTLGEKESRTIAVVWREYDDKWTQADFKKDKEFIIEELGPWSPQIVYANGQSVLTPTFGDHVVEIRSIEPEFKKLMEG